MLDDAQLRTLEERLRYLRELEERRTAILESVRDAGQARRRRWRRRSAAADSKARLEDIYLPVQAQAAHQGADRPRGGPGAARRRAARRPARGPGRGRRRVRRRRQGRRRPGGRPGGRAGDPGRAVRRGRRPDRRAARADVVARAGSPRRCARARRRRAPSSPTTSTSPSRSPSCPRTGSWRCSAARRRRSSTSPWSRRSRRAGTGPDRVRAVASRTASASPTGAGPATSGCRTPCAGPGAPGSSSTSASTCGCGCGRPPRTRRCGSSRRTCATCCSPRRPAPAPTMGLDPGFRTGVKVAVVDATGKVVATDTIYPHVPAQQVGRVAGHAGAAGPRARGRADRDRQRHRVPRDRQAGRPN